MATISQLPLARMRSVSSAVDALRRGQAAPIHGEEGAAFFAVETASAATAWAGTALLLTAERAAVLGLRAPGAGAIALALNEDEPREAILALADPTLPTPVDLTTRFSSVRFADALERAALELCKLAGLLPAAIRLPDNRANERSSRVAPVTIEAIGSYRRLASLSLQPVSEANVPLADAADARVVSFRPLDGGPEQVAIVIGDPTRVEAPLCRLHSECFTGDLLGSLKCDCGDQLRGAIRRMSEAGAGVLLYLAHEGRGIGLANKLRAYQLQDTGIDTVDANRQLGFGADERDWLAASVMLEHLRIDHVRLLTNNPRKVDGLSKLGVDVVERVPLVFPANRYNARYLHTKAERTGHLLSEQVDRRIA